jgi:hypothetical protein
VPALLDIYDQYLVCIFGLADTSHVQIDAIVKWLTDDYAEEQLALAAAAAKTARHAFRSRPDRWNPRSVCDPRRAGGYVGAER